MADELAVYAYKHEKLKSPADGQFLEENSLWADKYHNWHRVSLRLFL